MMAQIKAIGGHARIARNAALVLLCTFATGYLAVLTSRFTGNIAALWPANAFVLAALLCTPRREWIFYVLSGVAGNLSMNLWHGDGASLSLAFAFVNAAEPLIAASLLSYWRATDIL